MAIALHLPPGILPWCAVAARRCARLVPGLGGLLLCLCALRLRPALHRTGAPQAVHHHPRRIAIPNYVIWCSLGAKEAWASSTSRPAHDPDPEKWDHSMPPGEPVMCVLHRPAFCRRRSILRHLPCLGGIREQ